MKKGFCSIGSSKIFNNELRFHNWATEGNQIRRIEMIIEMARNNGLNPEGMTFHYITPSGFRKMRIYFSIIITPLRGSTTTTYDPKQRHIDPARTKSEGLK